MGECRNVENKMGMKIGSNSGNLYEPEQIWGVTGCDFKKKDKIGIFFMVYRGRGMVGGVWGKMFTFFFFKENVHRLVIKIVSLSQNNPIFLQSDKGDHDKFYFFLGKGDHDMTWQWPW